MGGVIQLVCERDAHGRAMRIPFSHRPTGLVASAMRAIAAAFAGIVLAAGSASAACRVIDQQRPQLKPVQVLGKSTALHRIRAVDVHDSTIVVLTDPAPAIHVFLRSGVREWGRQGAGPGELQNPVQIRVRQDSVYVLDALPGATRLTRYSLDGESQAVLLLSDISLATQFERSGDGFLVLASAFRSQQSHIARLGTPPDTVLSWTRAANVNITATKGATRSYSLALPFRPTPQWTVLGTSIAFWNAAGSAVTLHDHQGNRIGELELPRDSIRLSAADREAWFEHAFPGDFLGRTDDPLSVIRTRAREQITFLDFFPSVLDLLPDASGGVWVKRAPASHGEIWTRLGAARTITVQFPRGREVQAFGRYFVLATARDPDTDVELVEVFARSTVDASTAGR